MDLINYTAQFTFEGDFRARTNQEKLKKLDTKISRHQDKFDRTERNLNRLNIGGRALRAASVVAFPTRTIQRTSNWLRGGDFKANPLDEKLRLQADKLNYLKERRDRIANQL